MRGIYAIKIAIVAASLGTSGTAIYWLGKAHGEQTCIIQSQKDVAQLRQDLAAQTRKIQREGEERIREILAAESSGSCVDERIPDSILDQLR